MTRIVMAAIAGLAVWGAVATSPRADEPPLAPSPEAPPIWRALVDGRFAWKSTGPILGPDRHAADPHVSIKDPTVVRHDGQWHLFATVRMASGKVEIEYLRFADWKDAAKAERRVLRLHDKYYCAPQVFYFRPHRKWYLIYQIGNPAWNPSFGPGYSTTTDLGDPTSWTRPAPMMPGAPGGRRWLDFWVICDAAKAHLFYTSLDGKMWRAQTRFADFPLGWSEPRLALEGDIFEASHTYALRGMNKYLTIVEAQGDRRRYYKAYLADRLDGKWQPLADRIDRPLAGAANVTEKAPWTANISHGELLRAGVDERLEVDPAAPRFLYQGAADAEYRNNPYGKIPWRLGLLEPAER